MDRVRSSETAGSRLRKLSPVHQSSPGPPAPQPRQRRHSNPAQQAPPPSSSSTSAPQHLPSPPARRSSWRGRSPLAAALPGRQRGQCAAATAGRVARAGRGVQGRGGGGDGRGSGAAMGVRGAGRLWWGRSREGPAGGLRGQRDTVGCDFAFPGFAGPVAAGGSGARGRAAALRGGGRSGEPPERRL